MIIDLPLGLWIWLGLCAVVGLFVFGLAVYVTIQYVVNKIG